MANYRSKSCFAIAVAALAVVTTINGASATTATGTIAVSANIADSCTLAVNPLAFGTYSGTALAQTTTVVVNCTLGGLATLSAAVGSNGGSGFQRNMINASTQLPYNIYTTVGHTTIFGDGTSSTSTIAVTGTGSNQSTTLYGNIPASSVVLPGTYNDSVLVTLTY